MRQKRNLTEGPIAKTLLALAVPIMIANILQSAYGLVDTFWVGRLGNEGVASIALSFPIVFLMMSICIGVAIASSVLIAQYKGAQSHEQVDEVVGQSMLMTVLLSLVLGTLGFIFARPLIEITGTDPVVIEGAIDYLKISFLGAPFLFGYIIFQSLMRGVGEVKIPLYIVGGSLLLNMILDPIFIMGWGPIPGTGVAGAAWATIGTQSIAMIIGLIILIRGKHGMKLTRHHLRPNFPMLKRMLKIGIPSSIEMSSRAIGFSALTYIIAGFGALSIAAYGVGNQIFTLVMIPAMGFSLATSTIVGQNIGAAKFDRAQRTARRSAQMSFLGLTLIAIVLFFTSPYLAEWLLPNEPATTDLATVFLQIICLGVPFMGIQQSFAGAVNGAGKTNWSMIVGVLFLWVVQIPLAYYLSNHTALAETGFWISFPIANFLSAVAMVFVFRKINWEKSRIHHA